MAEFKQWRNENRTYLRDVIPLSSPYNIQIETSSICNMNCVYCGHSKHLYPERNMDMELFLEILDEARSFPDRIT